MNFDELFEQYYNLYRLEAETPETSDDEYVVAMRLANNAINRWANYDATYWKELFKEASTTGTGLSAYSAPADMREAGGWIDIGMTKVPIVDPQERQFRSADANLAYFTGNTSAGYTLNFNNAVTTGYPISYVYYKKPAEITTGTDEPEMANPYFIVHHMLAQRFRGSRNYSGYQTALRDAEEALKIMKMDNDSGTWSNPWSVADRSGSTWGE